MSSFQQGQLEIAKLSHEKNYFIYVSLGIGNWQLKVVNYLQNTFALYIVESRNMSFKNLKSLKSLVGDTKLQHM